MSSKFKKLLLSIIIVLIGIVISGTAQAGNVTGGGDILKEDVSNYITNHHFKPTAENNGMLFCIEKGKPFRASMTENKHNMQTWTDWTTKKCEKCDTVKTTAPDSGRFMRYESSSSVRTEKLSEELGYIFATAAERGIPIEGNMFMADTVWASSIGNTNSKTWLNTEAEAYMEWRKAWAAGEKKLEIAEPDNKIKVAVNQKAEKPYTVGKFQATFPTASGNPGKRITYTEDYNKRISTAIKRLVKAYNTAEKIKSTDVKQGRAWGDFRAARSTAKDLLDTTVDGIKIADLVEEQYGDIEVSDDLYNQIKTTCNSLIERQGELTNKHTEKKIKNGGNIDLIKTEHTTTDEDGSTRTTYTWESITLVEPIGDTTTTNLSDAEQDDYVFSYVSEVTINGYDAVNGGNVIQTLTNNVNQSEFDIIDENGGSELNTIVMKNGHSTRVNNLPSPNTPFYVRFNPKDGVKSIEVCVTVTYINGCEATITIYSGHSIEWVWTKNNKGQHTGGACETCTKAEVAGGHTHGDGTCTYTYATVRAWTNAEGNKTEIQKIAWFKRYPGSREAYGKKNWDNLSLSLPEDRRRIDITMELGGHAFLDQDQGKVTTGDNLFNLERNNGSEEALPNVEVWLYERDGENDKFTGKITTTLEDGSYVFTQLDAKKKYRVKFVYNGLMYKSLPNEILKHNLNPNSEDANYEDVTYNSDLWKKTSKVDEKDRDRWNNRFKEIGSYPQNYEIQNKGIFNELGQYNIAYPQEEIVSYFVQISANMQANGGDLKKACETVAQTHGNTEEAKRKTQFAADCRIEAWTNKDKIAIKDTYGGTNNSTYIYPVYDEFTTTTENATERIAGKDIKPIYEGQRFINCGLANRAQLDLALAKDVYKSTVTINGKTETYKYDRRGQPNATARIELEPYTYDVEQDENGNNITGAKVFIKGQDEVDFLNTMRNAYRNYNNRTSDNNPDSTYRGRDIETDKYNIFMRQEDAYNGVYPESQNDKVNNYDTYDKGYHQEINKSDDKKLNANDTDRYYSLADPDRLEVLVTYKISLKNQLSVGAKITEIVDYYDKNYQIVKDSNLTYIGNSKGGKIGEVAIETTSKYATRGNNQFINNDKYNTAYIKLPENLVLDAKEKNRYLYITFKLFNQEGDAGKLISEKFAAGQELEVLNVAEINGYTTELGLIDKDSTPGNVNMTGIAQFTTPEVQKHVNKEKYEDDADRAPAYVFTKQESRTLEGRVFEDYTDPNETIHTKEIRQGDGNISITNNEKKDKSDTPIKGVIVQLIEMKKEANGSTSDTTGYVRATAVTDDNGWYGFIGFVPGDYIVNYIYGADDATAMRTDSVRNKGQNATSYNGQDYQSTKYEAKNNNPYWYLTADNKNDAKDDDTRKQKVIAYSKTEYGKEIVNHKAEVFNAYLPTQPKHIEKSQATHEALINELEEKTYRNAYTEKMTIYMEYNGEQKQENKTLQTVEGAKEQQAYKHKITGVDFGVVERPRSELVIDQDVKHIKVTAADGVTVLFDTDTATNNLQWIKGKQPQDDIRKILYKGDNIDDYDKNELLNVIMDEELIDGATLEVTYGIKVTNNGENDEKATTKAKTIINYVSNNLTFEKNDNPNWKVVKLSEIQTDKPESTLIHAAMKMRINGQDETFLDLSNQQVILEATGENNPLFKALAPGESTGEVELKLKKKMSTEGANDNLTYTNMTEIVEIENTVGRYDHGATPGNQDINYEPQEHDTSGASYYARQEEYPDYPIPEKNTPQDGRIIVTPPTGSTHIYYWIGIVGTLIFAVGIYLIKKFVLDNRK